MDVQRRKELLAQPYWGYHEIAEYCDCGVTKAIQIKNQALKQFGGSIRYMSQYVTIDSVMQCIGTTRDREIEIIRNLEKESEA